MAPAKRLLLGRFTGSTPITLFRMQGAVAVNLRLEAAQRAAGRKSFDITSDERGFVHPRDPAERRFLGPNGMSMRPKGNMLAALFAGFSNDRVYMYEVPKGTPLPPELVLLHEHSDHYSVQPAVAMAAADLNNLLTGFLSQPGVIRGLGKESFYRRHPDMLPEEVGFSENA
jgi:hypothetical protein